MSAYQLLFATPACPDAQPIPNTRGVSRSEGRGMLATALAELKRRGWRQVRSLGIGDGFEVACGDSRVCVWLQDVSSAREWAYEEKCYA